LAERTRATGVATNAVTAGPDTAGAARASLAGRRPRLFRRLRL